MPHSHHTSPSYGERRKNTPCQFANESTEEEPCWGDVLPIDSVEQEDSDLDPEDNWRITWACEGHAALPFDEPYIVEPKFTP